MGAALGWSALAASSLIIGVWLASAWSWKPSTIGLVLAFGAGALISAVSFELALEGASIGSDAAVGIGLALGAIVYYVADGLIAGRSGGGGRENRRQSSNAGTSLALGAFLDGVPEQLVLGIGLAGGEAVDVALLAAIFVSNLPEGIGSAIDMRAAGSSDRQIMRLFGGVAAVCTLSGVVGYTIADSISGDTQAAVNGFAAGALLVMLIDSMIPEARKSAGRTAGLAAVVGFAVATALSGI